VAKLKDRCQQDTAVELKENLMKKKREFFEAERSEKKKEDEDDKLVLI
jgi:hypothetical protein